MFPLINKCQVLIICNNLPISLATPGAVSIHHACAAFPQVSGQLPGLKQCLSVLPDFLIPPCHATPLLMVLTCDLTLRIYDNDCLPAPFASSNIANHGFVQLSLLANLWIGTLLSSVFTFPVPRWTLPALPLTVLSGHFQSCFRTKQCSDHQSYIYLQSHLYVQPCYPLQLPGSHILKPWFQLSHPSGQALRCFLPRPW